MVVVGYCGILSGVWCVLVSCLVFEIVWLCFE